MVMTELLLLALLQSQLSPEPETIVMLLFFFSIVSTSTAVLPASLIVLRGIIAGSLLAAHART